jgi:hypothetical protein
LVIVLPVQDARLSIVGEAMSIDRTRVDQYLAFLGFALSFLFLLGVVALAFTIASGITDAPPLSITATTVAK